MARRPWSVSSLSSIDRVFETWYPRLVRAIRRRLGDPDEAEDVAQDAFIRLLDQTPRDPGAWLFTVAGRLASDRRRARDRHDRLHQAIGPADEPDPYRNLSQTETIHTVRSVLETLSERDRTILLMHHDGASYRDIAQRVGVAPSSVGSLLTRAHRRFLRHYEISIRSRSCHTPPLAPSAPTSTAS